MSPAPPAAGSPAGSPTGGPACPRCGTAVVPGARFCPACGAPLPTGPAAQAAASADPDGDAILRARLAEAAGDAYEVLGEVGRGGMAVVFLAWDRALARHAAVKVLRPALGADPLMARRFLQEGRTAAGLDAHPGVVRVYAAREARGLRYLVMQYVDGCSLEELLAARGPMAADLAADVVGQVARALDYAHARGVVHRDVKPGNVLLARDGLAAVTDFGIAKAVAGAAAHGAGDTLARTGFRFGTPAYMSPEHWRDEPLTPASDQYALGVVAYHLLAGRVPFGGSLYAMQQGHLHEPPPPIAGVPRALWAVVARMLAKRPADRFAGLAGVDDALAALPRDDVRVLRVRAGRLVRAVAAEQAARRPAPSAPPTADAAVLAAGTVRLPRAAPTPQSAPPTPPAPPAPNATGEATSAPAAVAAPPRPASDAPHHDAESVADDPAAEPSGEFPGVWSDDLIVPPPRRPRRVGLLAGAGLAVALGAAAWAARGGGDGPAVATARAPAAAATPPASPAPPGTALPASTAPGPTDTSPGEVAPAVPVDPPGATPPPGTAESPATTSAPRSRPSSAAPRRAAARPADADVQLAVRQLVASVAARDVGGLGRRLAPRAGDGTRARDFLVWLRSADRLTLTAPATRGAVALARGQARVAVRVPLRWRATAGPLKWTVRRDAVFWLTLAPDGGRWRGRTVTLANRFPP